MAVLRLTCWLGGIRHVMVLPADTVSALGRAYDQFNDQFNDQFITTAFTSALTTSLASSR